MQRCGKLRQSCNTGITQGYSSNTTGRCVRKTPLQGYSLINAETVVVINEADNLTREAQSALRRTMEKYSPNLRLILVANSSTKILAPIRSRCLLIRVAAPQQEEMITVLQNVVQKESLGKVAPGVLEQIASESKRNLRRALLMLEAVYAQKYCSLGMIDCSGRLDDPKITITPPDWEVYIKQVADAIIAEQSPQRYFFSSANAESCKCAECYTNC
jgi:replication factor C subunit 3/5